MIFLEHHAIGELTQITRAITCPEFRYRWGICDSKKNESPTFKTRVSPRTVNSICPSRTKPISSPLCLSSPPFPAPGAITCTFAFRIRPREKGIKRSSCLVRHSRHLADASTGDQAADLRPDCQILARPQTRAEFPRSLPELSPKNPGKDRRIGETTGI